MPFLFSASPRCHHRSAPRSNRQQAPEKHYGVDAFPPLRGPVDIGKVQPESKLVQRKRGTRTIEDREEPAPKNRRRGGQRSHLIQVTVADAEKDQDAPNKMVDMAATHGDVLERPDVMLDGSNQKPDGQESDEEADGRQEHPAVRPIRKGLVEEVPQLGQMEQQQHHRRNHNDEDQQDPLTRQMHTALNHSL